ncbi:hypothetical protein Barb7_03180 [Bacteroidales bacterium Barb7]|nr:hypothetical protein Barb7_03180 [Bacteroidales bacterium Barb7]
MKACFRTVELDPRRESEGESLLMRISLENETLPIHPYIRIKGTGVEKQLQPRLRICCEVQFGIVKQLRQAVIGCAVDIPQHNGNLFGQHRLCAKPRQEADTGLILIPFPPCNVLISRCRILIRPVIDKRMKTRLKPDGAKRMIHRLRLRPETGKGIAFYHTPRILIVSEEIKIVYLY